MQQDLLQTLGSPSFQDALLKEVSHNLWGEVEPVDGVRLGFTSGREINTFLIAFTLWVHVREGYRQIGDRRHLIPGKEVVVRKLLSPHEILASRDPTVVVQFLFKELVEEAKRGFAPRLFESDPRIGVTHFIGVVNQDWGEFTFPQCPLFDPLGGVKRPIVLLPDLRVREDYAALWACCGRCSSPFSCGQVVTWAGGNLRWVCSDCRCR